MNTRKWLIVFASLILCIGIGATQASAGAPYVPIYTFNNNLSILDPSGAATGGANDIVFTWDGTLKTSVATSLQVSNATIGPFVTTTQPQCTTGTGTTWTAHDVAVYGPGAYTVKASCPARSPGCATGTNPITFTVGPDEIGVHMLVNVAGAVNVDVVNVWQMNSVFGPSPMWTGACGSNSASTVWDLMSKDPGTGVNGFAMVDGPYTGARWNFNMIGAPINRIIDTANNNFTMIDGTGLTFGGTNDVRFTWDGTKKTSVECPQVSNASLSSPCAFFGAPWRVYDMAIYGPGTYTVYDDCPPGCPSCGLGNAVTFTVGSNQIGGHMLFDWKGSYNNIDVVDVWQPGVFGPSSLWTGACGTSDPAYLWDLMSYDWDLDGINGAPMTDGPFAGSNANFNLRTLCAGCGLCDPPDCNDNNLCTDDVCMGNICVHTSINCNDNNACTADTCDSATGCVYTPIVCNDNNACTADSCDPATGCVHTALVCDDNNLCTNDSCDPVTGCVFAPKCQPCATCDPAVGVCGTCCPEGWGKSLTTRGGGQKPTTVDLQIQTNFTVINDGCISGSGPSTVTCTPGTVMLVNVKAGQGPQPSSCTWNGVPIDLASPYTIICPDVSGDVGKLICDNKDAGGKDVDRITVTVQ